MSYANSGLSIVLTSFTFRLSERVTRPRTHHKNRPQNHKITEGWFRCVWTPPAMCYSWNNSIPTYINWCIYRTDTTHIRLSEIVTRPRTHHKNWPGNHKITEWWFRCIRFLIIPLFPWSMKRHFIRIFQVSSVDFCCLIPLSLRFNHFPGRIWDSYTF